VRAPSPVVLGYGRITVHQQGAPPENFQWAWDLRRTVHEPARSSSRALRAAAPLALGLIAHRAVKSQLAAILAIMTK